MKLVSAVKGAEGAIILDEEGEAVQWISRSNEERLRLRAAYLAVVLRASSVLRRQIGLGPMRGLVLCYEGASFVIEELDRGYYVILELGPAANIGEARYRMEDIAARLRDEIGG